MPFIHKLGVLSAVDGVDDHTTTPSGEVSREKSLEIHCGEVKVLEVDPVRKRSRFDEERRGKEVEGQGRETDEPNAQVLRVSWRERRMGLQLSR